jgi:hypothetical protein
MPNSMGVSAPLLFEMEVRFQPKVWHRLNNSTVPLDRGLPHLPLTFTISKCAKLLFTNAETHNLALKWNLSPLPPIDAFDACPRQWHK